VPTLEVTAGLAEPFAYGRCFHEHLYPASPAAGANFSLALVSEYETRLRAILFTLVTDGNAANRAVTVDYADNAGRVVCSNGFGAVVVASTTQVCCGKAALGVSDFAAGTTVFFPIEPLFLDGGHAIQINVASKQAGDQLSAIVLTVERFRTGKAGYESGELDVFGRR